MALTIEPRSKMAPHVQEILTKHGCIIKTRIGMHETEEDHCSQKGLIVLHIYSKKDQIDELNTDLNSVEGVKANYMIV